MGKKIFSQGMGKADTTMVEAGGPGSVPRGAPPGVKNGGV